WSEKGCERLQLLSCVVLYLNEHRWGKTLDTGWDDWDVEIYCHPWTVVQVCTAQEDHGSGKHLIHVRYRLRPSGTMNAMAMAGGLGLLTAASLQTWPVALGAGLFVTTCLCR